MHLKKKELIYFGGSIRGGREDVQIYQALISHLKDHGSVLTEHIGDSQLGIVGEHSLDSGFIHDRDLTWLFSATKCVFEVTRPSLGVGYEIGRIIEFNRRSPLDWKKDILCLYRPQEGKNLSAMIKGSSAIVADYQTIKDAEKVIDHFFRK